MRDYTISQLVVVMVKGGMEFIVMGEGETKERYKVQASEAGQEMMRLMNEKWKLVEGFGRP